MEINKLKTSLVNFFNSDLKINKIIDLSNDLNNYFEIYINDNISISLIEFEDGEIVFDPISREEISYLFNIYILKNNLFLSKLINFSKNFNKKFSLKKEDKDFIDYESFFSIFESKHIENFYYDRPYFYISLINEFKNLSLNLYFNIENYKVEPNFYYDGKKNFKSNELDNLLKVIIEDINKNENI